MLSAIREEARRKENSNTFPRDNAKARYIQVIKFPATPCVQENPSARTIYL